MTHAVDGALDRADTDKAKDPAKVDDKRPIRQRVVDIEKTGDDDVLQEMDQVEQSLSGVTRRPGCL